jgi:hypothetical protein
VSAPARKDEKGWAGAGMVARRATVGAGNVLVLKCVSFEPEAIRVVRGVVRVERGEHARGAGRRRGARRRHRRG